MLHPGCTGTRGAPHPEPMWCTPRAASSGVKGLWEAVCLPQPSPSGGDPQGHGARGPAAPLLKVCAHRACCLHGQDRSHLVQGSDQDPDLTDAGGEQQSPCGLPVGFAMAEDLGVGQESRALGTRRRRHRAAGGHSTQPGPSTGGGGRAPAWEGARGHCATDVPVPCTPGRAALGAVTELGSRGQQCRVPPHTIQRLLSTASQGQTPPHVPEAPQTGAGPTGKWRQGQQHGHSPVPESHWPCLPPGAAEQPQPPGPSPGARQPHLLQLRGRGERGQRLRGGSGGRGGCGRMSGRIRGHRLQSL